MLADFGFTRIATAQVEMLVEKTTASFMAPELLFPAKFGLSKEVPSKEADVYVFGMTVYQVLTGKWPFFPRRETEVMLAVVSGERPPKPENAEGTGMTEVVWELLRECWREDRTTRPSISNILKILPVRERPKAGSFNATGMFRPSSTHVLRTNAA